MPGGRSSRSPSRAPASSTWRCCCRSCSYGAPSAGAARSPPARLTGALLLPWFLAGPSDFVHDTISLLVSFHPIRFANTLYLLALNTFGVTLPFWLTGLVVLASLAAVVAVVHRRQPDLPELLRWLALMLLVANLVNKQAFYNQFWLVGALVAASMATRASTSSSRNGG